MNGIGTQIIETERLLLRRMTLEDAPAMFRNWTGDPLVARWVTWDTHESPEATAEYAAFKAQRYDKPFCFDWIVCLKETGEPIGEIEAVEVSRACRLVEMGHCYGSRFWNRGYATEALQAFIQYMFEQVGVEKILARHLSVNPASGRTMQKAGMHYDATLPGYFVDKTTDQRCDVICYSIDRP